MLGPDGASGETICQKVCRGRSGGAKVIGIAGTVALRAGGVVRGSPSAKSGRTLSGAV
jgi:hypothetical protein